MKYSVVQLDRNNEIFIFFPSDSFLGNINIADSWGFWIRNKKEINNNDIFIGSLLESRIRLKLTEKQILSFKTTSLKLKQFKIVVVR